MSFAPLCSGNQLQLRSGGLRPERVHQAGGLQRVHALRQHLLLHQQHPGVGQRPLHLHGPHPQRSVHLWTGSTQRQR